MQDALKECNERYFEREVNMTENMMLCGYLGICSCAPYSLTVFW